MDQIQNSRSALDFVGLTVSNNCWDNLILILQYPTTAYAEEKGAWLPANKDEIVYTDGVVLSVTSPSNNCISFLFPCHQFVEVSSEQALLQDTWWWIPRVKKAVSLQFALRLIGGHWFSLAVAWKSEWSPSSVGVFDIHRLLDYIDIIWLVNIGTSMLSGWDLGLHLPLP